MENSNSNIDLFSDNRSFLLGDDGAAGTDTNESVTGLIDYRWEDTRNQMKTKIFFNHNKRTPVLYKSRSDTTQATIDYI